MEAAIGVEVGVHVQLILRQAGHGVGGHVAVGGSVHVGVVGLVGQVEEQLLGGVLLAAAQGGMFEHMRHTHVILTRGLEGDLEQAVGVVIGQVEQLGAGLLVNETDNICVDEGEGRDLHHLKAVSFGDRLQQFFGTLFVLFPSHR